MYLSMRHHEVAVLDNFSKRNWELELNAQPLIPVSPLLNRVRAWREVTGRHIGIFVGDLCEYNRVPRFCATFSLTPLFITASNLRRPSP